ncbi:hypothetical protein RWK44_28240 [Rhizobium sp. 25PS6]|uniref:hypothetical protein n=1 Tax=Rhizobium sp. 25PS6 TaxID=3075622 RepID=UPI0028FDB9AB|nr:hypothetical protein [Rhizobium sp. 25PS6]MDU0364288.1 hypothetical protein [Rhizobium sp. 25PS6]
MSLTCELIDDVGHEAIQFLEQSLRAFESFGHGKTSIQTLLPILVRRQKLARKPILNGRLGQADFRKHVAAGSGRISSLSSSSHCMVSNNSSLLISAGTNS